LLNNSICILIKAITTRPVDCEAEKPEERRKIINIGLISDALRRCRYMSFFKLGMDAVQEVLVLGLMLVFIFAIVYSGIDWTYKIGIGAMVVSLVFIATLASQALKQQREEERKRRR
jgi:hypothetical protein